MSTNQSTNQSIKQTNKQSVNQSINHQSISQSINQSVTRPRQIITFFRESLDHGKYALQHLFDTVYVLYPIYLPFYRNTLNNFHSSSKITWRTWRISHHVIRLGRRCKHISHVVERSIEYYYCLSAFPSLYPLSAIL